MSDGLNVPQGRDGNPFIVADNLDVPPPGSCRINGDVTLHGTSVVGGKVNFRRGTLV